MKIGLLGKGTIGTGVFNLASKADWLEVCKVLDKKIEASCMVTDINAVVNDHGIETVVETMGGLHPACEYAMKALENGKHFVTANKLLVSTYGQELLAAARRHGKAFLYSAACGGGIPFLRNLMAAREVDSISSLGGILNGTTNYILSSMRSADLSYEEALLNAQKLGYAERDPSSDVDGLDTMRKLMLSCAVGFNSFVKPEGIPVRGISQIDTQDIEYSKAHCCSIRLCAYSEMKDGRLAAYVQPELCRLNSHENATVSNLNYAWYKGQSCGTMGFGGQGAGMYPTATNILADLKAIESGILYMTSDKCSPLQIDNSRQMRSYYVRLESGFDFPEDLIEESCVSGNQRFITTRAMPVAVMFELLGNEKKAFFAGKEVQSC